MTRRSKFLVAFLIAMLVVGTGTAYAYWTAGATGNAAASATSLNAPTSGSATANSATQITVNWTNPGSQLPGAQYRVTHSGDSLDGTVACTTASNSCVDTNTLTASTAYSYSIVAFLGTQWVSGPATASATTPSTGATKLVITSGPVAGATSSGNATLGPITVQLQDSTGTPINAGAGGAAVTLASNSGTAKFAATSNGSNISSITIPNGSSSVNFFYGDNTAGTPTITASRAGLTSATQVEFIGLKLAFTTGAVSGAASTSATLGPITVQLQRISGSTPQTTAAPLTVNLASNSTGTAVFATTSGGSAVTSVTIPSGSNSASFFYGDTKSGTQQITASAITGITSATQNATITAGTATKLVITSAPVFGATSAGNATLGPITVQQQDANGNPVNVGAGFSVGLASTSGTAKFASTSNGANISSITIPNGSSSVNFFYGDNTSGTPTITASRAGLTSTTQVEYVGLKFAFTSAAVSGTASSSATLGPISVQLQTASGTPVTPTVATTVNLSSTGNETFAASSGGSAITSVTIPSGSNSASFFYGNTLAGTQTITAAATGVTAGTQNATITAGTLVNLVYTSSSNDCSSGAVFLGSNGATWTTKVGVADAFGNIGINGAGDITLSVTKPGVSGGMLTVPSGYKIAANANPGVTANTFSYQIATGQPPAVTITASASGYTSATCAVDR